MASDAPSPHAGHRARLRQRLLEAPADLSEAEILELLLSYAIPRRDVAPLADSLLRRFGSLARVLAAPATDLLQIPGVGETVVALLRLVARLSLSTSVSEESMSTDRDPAQQPPLFHVPENTMEPEGGGPKDHPRTFTDDEVANTLSLLPKAWGAGSSEAFKTLLREDLPYNSESTRHRRTNNILNRFFSDRRMDTPLAYLAAHCGSPEDLKPALFFEMLRAEPLAARVAEETVWANVPQGYVGREAIRNRILESVPEMSEASQTKTLRAIRNTYTLLGVASLSGEDLVVRVREGTAEAFLYVLFALYPVPGVYTLGDLEQGPMRRWLLWDRDWMRRQLYALRDLGLVAKVSEIDTVRQFTTAMGQMQALRAYYEDGPPRGRVLREE